jgi:hypothetical protein
MSCYEIRQCGNLGRTHEAHAGIEAEGTSCSDSREHRQKCCRYDDVHAPTRGSHEGRSETAKFQGEKL